MNRHERRARKSAARRGLEVAMDATPHLESEHNVLAVVVSYQGISGLTVENLFELERAAFATGHGFAFRSINRMPLDLARNESVTKVRASKATSGLFLDDDCQVEATWLPRALGLLDAGLDVVTAPIRLRGERTEFNIAPLGPPVDIAGERVVETLWTGFGCVLVKRHVLEAMHDKLPKMHYRSRKVEGMMSCGLFRSEIVPRHLLGVEDDLDTSEYVLDDRVWSLRARAAGFKIHSLIDVDTAHDGYSGNWGKTFDLCVVCDNCTLQAGPLEGASAAKPLPEGGPYQCCMCEGKDSLFDWHRPMKKLATEETVMASSAV